MVIGLSGTDPKQTPTMTMFKYDYKNKKFLEHYKCDAETGYIE